MSAFKKTLINAEGFFDFFRSRFSGVGELFSGWLTGGIVGGVLGVIVMIEENKLDDFVEQNAEYSDTVLLADFPNGCDMNNSYFLAQKGPNNQYTLYEGGRWHYQPLSVSESEEFAEDFNNCLDAAEKAKKLQEGFTIYSGYEVTEPLRSIDLNDADDTDSFRELKHGPDRKSQTLAEWSESLGEDKNGLSEFRALWSDAISDFENGDIYDHANDADVKTFEYTDSYSEYHMELPKYGAVGCAFIGALLCGFGTSPNSAARSRKANRDERRAAIDTKPLDF